MPGVSPFKLPCQLGCDDFADLIIKKLDNYCLQNKTLGLNEDQKIALNDEKLPVEEALKTIPLILLQSTQI